MYIAIFFMKDNSIVKKVYATYPSDEMIVSSGLDWDDICSYEVHY